MSRLNRKGFTLIEVVVVASIIAILAGILVPTIFNQIEEANKTKALAECKSIVNAIVLFKKDTGLWPVYTSGTTFPCSSENATVATIMTNNSNPLPALDAGATGWVTTTKASSYDFLVSKASIDANICYPKDETNLRPSWRGPYMSDTPPDPWGNPYVINIGDLLSNDASLKIWVISAGADGIIQTPTINDSTSGDDIGSRLR